jgi:uncharacterized membrane protein YhaH (DUF805 family)
LFSFDGRITRRRFWINFVLVIAIPLSIAATAIDMMLGYEDLDGPGNLLYLAELWPALAVSVKRWHDRDKSGWWTLVNLIPIVGSIWALIETGFLRGTEGPNRFGPDPLAQGAAA